MDTPVNRRTCRRYYNLISNWYNCDWFWEYAAAFGVGAGAGVLTAAAGGFFATIGAALGGAATSGVNNIIAQTEKKIPDP